MADLAHEIGGAAGVRYLKTADRLYEEKSSPRWNLEKLSGRLVELRATRSSSVLTAAMGLVAQAQRDGENPVWISGLDSCFFPPDALEGGVDLETLPVVRVEEQAMSKVADKLARSGAFGLIVLDLFGSPFTGDRSEGGDNQSSGWKHRAVISTAAQSRLLGLAHAHDVAIVFLTSTKGSATAYGSLVSLRGAAERRWVERDLFSIRIRVVKDKQHSPGWEYEEVCRGTPGLR